MRTFFVPYKACGAFKISSKIPLLSPNENSKIDFDSDEKIPWSWWIKWDKLYYYDASCEIQTIDNRCELASQLKFPDYNDIESDDDGDESESD